MRSVLLIALTQLLGCGFARLGLMRDSVYWESAGVSR
jgi:hypothetical protein